MFNKDIPREQHFFCKNGEELSSLHDLLREFGKNIIGENLENYNFHTYNNNNDYANWIENVFELKEEAQKLREAKTKEESFNIIKSVLNSTKKREYSDIDAEEKPKEENNETPKEDINNIDVRLDAEGKPTFINSSEEMVENIKLMEKNSQKNIDFFKEKEVLQEEYKKVSEELSEARKHSYDVFIPGIKMMNIKPKMKYIEASGSEEDAKKLLRYMDEIMKEIREAKERKEVDLKKEILEAAKREESEAQIIKENSQSNESQNQEA